MKSVLDHYLLPYQLDYFFCENNLVFEKSRQIGVTWTCAMKTVVRSFSANSRLTHYVAQDQLSSQDFIKTCVEFLIAWKIPEDNYKATKGNITFSNGSEIIAHTSNPKTLRGGKGVVILDEFAFHEDQKELLAAAQPLTNWQGWTEIISTHNGPFTEFNQQILSAKKKENGYKHFRIDIYDAIEQGLVEKINKERTEQVTREQYLQNLKRTSTSFTFAQEYECKIANEASYIVDQKLYKDLEVEDIPTYLDEDLNDINIGIDVGRTKNWTVIWCLQKYVDTETQKIKHKTVAVNVMQDVAIQDQIDECMKYAKHNGVKNIYIDKGLFGISLYEALENEMGCNCVGKQITKTYQHELCEKIRKAFEFKEIDVPKNNEIMADICSMSQTYKNGSVKYGGGVGDSHADAFYALALALDASEEPEICWA